MKKLFFFFPGLCFFFPPQKLNEWMTCELFQEKKTQKKHRFWKKKTVTYAWIIIDKKWFYTLISHFASFLEKNQLSITHFGMNGLWTFPGKKKTQVVFFFSRFFVISEKKKTPISDLNEWMTNVHARGKKKYDTFDWANRSEHFPKFCRKKHFFPLE